MARLSSLCHAVCSWPAFLSCLFVHLHPLTASLPEARTLATWPATMALASLLSCSSRPTSALRARICKQHMCAPCAASSGQQWPMAHAKGSRTGGMWVCWGSMSKSCRCVSAASLPAGVQATATAVAYHPPNKQLTTAHRRNPAQPLWDPAVAASSSAHQASGWLLLVGPVLALGLMLVLSLHRPACRCFWRLLCWCRHQNPCWGLTKGLSILAAYCPLESPLNGSCHSCCSCVSPCHGSSCYCCYRHRKCLGLRTQHFRCLRILLVCFHMIFAVLNSRAD